MKKILTVVLLLVAFVSFGQMPKVQKAVIKTPYAQCEEAKSIIENIAPRYLDGLVTINVNYRTKTTQVTFHPDRTNIEEIKTAIANAGFDADDVTANPDIYKKLPACCKKPEDGGPAPKVPKQ